MSLKMIIVPVFLSVGSVLCLAAEQPAENSSARSDIRMVSTTNCSMRIDAEFPGGNIKIDRIEGDRVYLRPDLRDTPRWWFYWYFRVHGAGGRTVSFEFTNGDPVGVRGPAISTDGGRTWSWLGSETAGKASFTYTFSKEADDTRFAYTIPYLEANLQAFLKSLGADPHLKIDSLCRTRRGRDVEAIYLGRLDAKPDYRVLVTARHHACEAMANYVLEGLVRAILQNKDRQWFHEHVEFLIVPFMDKDGVEQGDQGKLRAPHDPNRDYNGTSIYPSVAGLREQIPHWSKGKLRMALDLHCPYIRGDRNEKIFFVGLPSERIWRNVQQLSEILESLRPISLPYSAKDNLPFGQEWNNMAKLGEGLSMADWAARIPGVDIAASIEIPYANVSGYPVTPDSARGFGETLVQSIGRYLQR